MLAINKTPSLALLFVAVALHLAACSKSADPAPDTTPPAPAKDTFYFGADLSYVNQVLDHGGVYKDNGVVTSPYKIFKDHGANLIRLRLWHNPTWTKDVYGPAGTQLYSDLYDVEKAIRLVKAQGLSVLLDFHYSDTWADPGHQQIPAAWTGITSLQVLKDSVYNYTLKTLTYLNAKGLLPNMVQIGNESNCGLMYSNAPAGFPKLNGCDGNWQNLGEVINSAIAAVKQVSSSIKIILHVSEPRYVTWWFDNITANGKVTGFDMIGFSYYPLWQTGVALNQLGDNIAQFKSRYGKKVMIMETGYPWTTQYADSYNNIMGSETPVAGYPFTQQGQYDMMKEMTQQVITGGGSGIVYWEPAWITSGLKDQYGTGSSWENVTLFDFSGNVLLGMDYMKFGYRF